MDVTMAQHINIDPRELGITLSRDIFGRWAAKGKLEKENEWGINIQYGAEGTENQGKLLITYVTPDDHQIQVKFSATRYAMDPVGYLDLIVTDVMEMTEQARKDASPLILPSQAPFPKTAIGDAVNKVIH
jgi:hypothetical protein